MNTEIYNSEMQILNDFLEPIFVGRDKELQQLSKYTSIVDSITIITGIGGIGKTALLRNFETKFSNQFNGGIYHLTGDISSKVILEKLSIINEESEHSLVVIDDAELLKLTELEKIKSFLFNKNVSLILSGRMVALDDVANILVLSGLPTNELIKARKKYLPSVPKEALEIINGHPLAFELLQSLSPEQLNEFIETNAKTTAKNKPTINEKIYKIDIQKKTEVKVDIIGMAFASLLAIVAQTNSVKTEKNLIDEINKVKEEIAELVVNRTENLNNPHAATEFVNLREEPNPKHGKIIVVLYPGQVVELISVTNQWAKVELSSVGSSRNIKGWVHTKYIRPL